MLFVAITGFLSLKILAEVNKETATAPQKICYIDFDKALKDGPEAQRQIKELETQETTFLVWEQEEKVKLAREANTLNETLEKMTPQKAKTEREKFNKKVAEFEQESAKKRQEVGKNQQDILDKLKTIYLHEGKLIAEEKKCSMLLNAAALVWVADSFAKDADISQETSKRVNTKYPLKETQNLKKPEPKKAATPKKK